MPRKKSGATLSPWVSAHPDGREKRFIQIGNSLMLSKKVQKLNAGARWMYFSMVMEAGGRSSFEFPRSAARKYGISPTSMERHCDELIAKGFIEKTSSGKIARMPNQYKFSLTWKQESHAE